MVPSAARTAHQRKRRWSPAGAPGTILRPVRESLTCRGTRVIAAVTVAEARIGTKQVERERPAGGRTLGVSPRRVQIAYARRPRIRERAVGVDLDHRRAGVLIDVVDGEHERAACADRHLIAGLQVLSPIDTTEEGRVVFPGHTTNSAKLIFWIPAGRPVCDPAGSLTFRVGPWLLLCLSRWPLHPGERWPGVRGNEDLRIADDAQVGAVSGRSRGAQRRRAGARCPSHDHSVRSQPVPVRAELRRALVGQHTTDFRICVRLGRL